MTASRDGKGALSLYVVSIHSNNKKREKLFVSRFFFLATEKWPCEFLAADWIKNDFIERSRQALNSPFHIYVYPSDEYSDELNYYHFC